jgi:hypothetical protein
MKTAFIEQLYVSCVYYAIPALARLGGSAEVLSNIGLHLRKQAISFDIAVRVFADPFALTDQVHIEGSEQRQLPKFDPAEGRRQRNVPDV